MSVDSVKGGYEKFHRVLMKSIMSILEDEANYKKVIRGVEKRFFDSDNDLEDNDIVEKGVDRKDLHRSKIFYGYAEIDEAFYILKDIPFYIRRFPANINIISKSRYFTYHITNYFNWVYVLRERLKTYQTRVLRMYKKFYNPNVLSITTTAMNKLFESFDSIIGKRGSLIHESHFSDEDLDRISFVELIESDKRSVEFELLLKESTREFRKEWRKIFNGNDKELEWILDYFFSLLYDLIFDDEENMVYPFE